MPLFLAILFFLQAAHSHKMGQGDDGGPIIVGPQEEIPGQSIRPDGPIGPAGFPEETESHESEDGPVPIFQQYPLVSCSLCKTFWQIIEPSAQPMNVQMVRLALKVRRWFPTEKGRSGSPVRVTRSQRRVGSAPGRTGHFPLVHGHLSVPWGLGQFKLCVVLVLLVSGF